MAEQTLGRRIIDTDITDVKIFNKMYRKRAEMHYINAYSGHADKNDLDAYVKKVEELQKLILVHGELKQMEPFAERVRKANKGIEVLTPKRGEEIIIV